MVDPVLPPVETVKFATGNENCMEGLADGKEGSISHTRKKYLFAPVNAILKLEKVREADDATSVAPV